MSAAKTVYPVFLSSLCRRAPGLFALRQKVYEDLGSKELIYVDEQAQPRDTVAHEPLETVDDLITRIRQSSVFICILAGTSHGTPISVRGHTSRASYLEIELVQATLFHKRIRLVVRDDFEPEPQLAELLSVIQGEFSDWHARERVSHERLYETIAKIVNAEMKRGTLRLPTAAMPAIRRLTQALWTSRKSAAAHQPLLFLGGLLTAERGAPNENLLRSIIQSIKVEQVEERRLTRAWLGLRELLSLSPDGEGASPWLSYWNDLLEEWSKAASWYGIHADSPMSPLAASNSIALIRERRRQVGQLSKGADAIFPGGALASAKYSIAKRLISATDKNHRLKEALHDIGRAMEENPRDPSGILAIRGSILYQLGSLPDAIEDYRRVLSIRNNLQAPVNQIGDAETELGFALVLNWQPRVGAALCESGVEKLRTGARTGFLIRGLRKASFAYLAAGYVIAAWRAREEAKALAESSTSFDQRP